MSKLNRLTENVIARSEATKNVIARSEATKQPHKFTDK